MQAVANVSELNALINGSLTDFDPEKFVTAARQLMDGHSIGCPQLESGLYLYRGRIVEHVNAIADLSYPPEKFAALGRANVLNCSMFYATGSRFGVLHELRAQAGTCVLVSQWRTRKAPTLMPIGYFDDIFSEIGAVRALPEWLDKVDHHVKRSREFFNALARLFSKVDHPEKYKFSAAIVTCLLAEPMSGVMYPSISHNAKFDNFAFLPLWVDRNIEFVGVEKIYVTSVDGDAYNVEVTDFGTSPDGVRVDWKGRVQQWVTSLNAGERLDSRWDGSRWIVTMPDGREIDPS